MISGILLWFEAVESLTSTAPTMRTGLRGDDQSFRMLCHSAVPQRRTSGRHQGERQNEARFRRRQFLQQDKEPGRRNKQCGYQVNAQAEKVPYCDSRISSLPTPAQRGKHTVKVCHKVLPLEVHESLEGGLNWCSCAKSPNHNDCADSIVIGLNKRCRSRRGQAPHIGSQLEEAAGMTCQRDSITWPSSDLQGPNISKRNPREQENQEEGWRFDADDQQRSHKCKSRHHRPAKVVRDTAVNASHVLRGTI